MGARTEAWRRFAGRGKRQGLVKGGLLVGVEGRQGLDSGEMHYTVFHSRRTHSIVGLEPGLTEGRGTACV